MTARPPFCKVIIALWDKSNSSLCKNHYNVSQTHNPLLPPSPPTPSNRLSSSQYYHFRSTVKRDDFFAYVYFSNVTVSQTSVSSGPMKMRCFGRETNNVCQTTVACFVHVAGRFSSFRLYFSSHNLLIGWQVLGFQILSRITQRYGSRTDKSSL